jgi:hypothetical protein
LYRLEEEDAHLCPVRALSDWIDAAEITDGYVFRKIGSGERPVESNTPMVSDFFFPCKTYQTFCQTSEQFLELFRNNLLDIKIDPTPYGTHSFRRGGCQYLAGERRWLLRTICEWGGWSREFSSMTIVKYLISWNDNPTEQREDYFNPAGKPAIKCYHCGRSCHCA